MLRGVGDWLRQNGESIYGTRGGPYKSSNVVASTRKGNAIYVHLLKPATRMTLSPIPAKFATPCSSPAERSR